MSKQKAEGRLCVPWCTGLNSEPRAVAKRLGALLTALGSLDGLVQGSLPNELWDYRMRLHERLTAEGWRIKAKQRSGWAVLPPLEKKAEG